MQILSLNKVNELRLYGPVRKFVRTVGPLKIHLNLNIFHPIEARDSAIFLMALKLPFSLIKILILFAL